MFCREWLAQLEQHQHELRQVGLQTVAVGLGEAKHIERYCYSLAPSITCVTQPNNDAHTAYGLSQGKFKEVASAGVFKAAVRNFSKGNFGGQPTGDPTMMPGTFIVNKDGIVTYTYYSKNPADHPPMAELVAGGRAL